jgi:hypothetical protein
MSGEADHGSRLNESWAAGGIWQAEAENLRRGSTKAMASIGVTTAAAISGQKRKIADFYAAGKTIPELAAEYECGVGTIWRALQPEIQTAA